MSTKNTLVEKLKAIIRDGSASDGEQQNAITILLKMRGRGVDIGSIPEPPIKRPIQVIVKVYDVIEHVHSYVFVCNKIPRKRIKKLQAEPGMIFSAADLYAPVPVQEEIYYVPKFSLFVRESVRINKVDAASGKIMKYGHEYPIDIKLQFESYDRIGTGWVLDEKCGKTQAYSERI